MRLSQEVKNSIITTIVRQMTLPACIVCLFFWLILFWFFPDYKMRLVNVLPFFILTLLSWYFVGKGKIQTGGNCLVAGFISVVILGMVSAGGVKAPAYIGILPCMVLIAILHGPVWAGGYIAFMVILGAVSIKLTSLGILAHGQTSEALLLFAYGLLAVFSLILITIPIRLLNRALADTLKAAREKADAKAELDAILKRTPDIIFKADVDGKFTFINDAISRYGYHPAELLGKDIRKYAHGDDIDASAIRFKERSAGMADTHKFQIKLLSNPRVSPGENQGEHIFSVTTQAIYNGSAKREENYIGFQGIARDITKKRADEEQLLRFATVIEQADEEVLIMDSNGFIEYVNPSFEDKTGYIGDEINGKHSVFLKSNLQNDQFYGDLWEKVLDKQTWKGTIQNKAKNGNILIHDVSITPILNGNGKITSFVSIGRDITRKTELERQVRQSQKMEAIGTLAGGIAHDFNNILSGILGYSQLVHKDLQGLPSLAKTTKKMDRVIKASYRARDLVSQILSFSRSGRKDISPINVNFVAGEVLQLLRASLPSFIQIDSSLKAVNYVVADPTSIHQIFMNLCTNSRDAMMENGGTLMVSTRDVRVDEKTADGIIPGTFVRISVSDTGDGMDKDVLDKILEPFYTTKPKGKGTGMGLSLVQGIITSLKGFFKITSTPGKGTVFDVFLPVSHSSTGEEFPKKGSERGLEGKETLLFVDDELLVAEMTRDLLEDYGYQVRIFSSSLDAFEHFKENQGAYNMVISDVTMPGLTGDKLAEQILSIRPDIPIILCTGFSERLNREKAQKMGIAALLLKPVPEKEMVSTIRRILDKNQQ